MLVSQPKRPIPSAIPEGLELFAIGDVHGRSAALQECLELIAETDLPDDKLRALVFLGDLIDRGPDSIGACQLALAAEEFADIVYFLPGNHELMMIDVIDGKSPEHWLMNGGSTVMKEVSGGQDLQLSDCAQALKSHFPMEYVDHIRSAPSHLVLGDLLFVHAGLHPHEDPEEHLDRKRPLMGDYHWASIRYPFLNWQGGWDHDGGRYFWGDRVVVHGHTPAVREDLRDNPEALSICDGVDDFRSVCLDVGASSRDQVGWAHFQREQGQTFMQVHACVS